MPARPAARPRKRQYRGEARLASQLMICEFPAAALGQGDELLRTVCMGDGNEGIHAFALAKVRIRNPRNSRDGTAFHIEHTPGVANLAEPKYFHRRIPLGAVGAGMNGVDPSTHQPWLEVEADFDVLCTRRDVMRAAKGGK
jgi:hypothetical protein